MTRLSLLLILFGAVLALAQGQSPRLSASHQRELEYGGTSYRMYRAPGKYNMGSRKKKKCKKSDKKCRGGYYQMKYRWRNKQYKSSKPDDSSDGIPHSHYHVHEYNNGPHQPTPSPPKPSPTPPTPSRPDLPPVVPPVAQTRMPSVDYPITRPPNPSPIMTSTPREPTVTEPPSYIPVISVLSPAPTPAARNATIATAPTVSPTSASMINNTLGGSAGEKTAAPTASIVAATTKPTDQIEFRPPDLVVTTTKAPTTSPTAEAVEALETHSLKTSTLSFRASGTTNLGEHEIEFFEEVERVLAPYAASEIGSILTKFFLSIIFEHDKLDIVSLGLTGENTLYRSVFTVSAEFSVEGVADEISQFHTHQATKILNDLFKDMLLSRLLLGLSNKGIKISNIAEYDIADEPAGDSSNDGGTPMTPNSEDDRGAPQPASGSSSRTQKNILLITLFAGAVVVLTLSIAIYFNVRRRRRYYHYGEQVAQASKGGGSASGPGSLAGSSQGSASKIQRAALATKSYDSRDFLRRDATKSSGLEPMLDDIENYYASPSYEEEKSEMEPLEPPAALPPPSDGPEPIGGATLTALDGSESVGQLNQTYPEFDMFVGLKAPMSPQSTTFDIPPSSPSSENRQNSPISPYWSVDGAISVPDDEEYVNDRRRWQDEANDIGLDAPEHSSSHDSSDAYNSSSGSPSEESEGGWSDEHDSDDEHRQVQVLPSID